MFLGQAADDVITACALLIGKELVGFVYPDSAVISQVQEACAKVQPYYARPSKYIKLEVVPKTANGYVKYCLSRFQTLGAE